MRLQESHGKAKGKEREMVKANKQAAPIENPILTSCLGEALSIELNVEDANWYNEDQELVYTGNTYYLPVLEELLNRVDFFL